MPYTPPSHHSPASSLAVTPTLSRTGSYTTSPPRSPGPRLSLPRSISSTAYMHKSRRSPMAQPTSNSNDHNNSDQNEKHGSSISSSLRQSPPPVSDGPIPTGAVMSPPDSTLNSSDDEEADRRAYKVEELRELEDAVRRSLAPNGTHPASELSPVEVEAVEKKIRNLKIQMPPKQAVEETLQLRPRLPATARKVSHSRSSTESAIMDQRGQFSSSPTSDDEESDSEGLTLSRKPLLLRKKSGELVKPAIRPPSRRKHSSAPGTPTYSKAVHFNEDIEQVRHFLQVDRPIAVSAGGSPAEGYEEEAEFPFKYPDTPSSPGDLEIRLGHFSEGDDRKWCPVRLEKLSLSSDQKSLLGVVAVANWGFQKYVAVRFTFDYWKTTSEVVAEYSNEVRQTPREDGYDQFNFNIRLSDLANIDNKTLLVCVKYNVNGQDHWDNNSGMNFQADFSRRQKPKAAPAPIGVRPPRSRHNSSSSSKPTARAVATLDEEFSNTFDTAPAIRFRKAPTVTRSLSDSPLRRTTPAGQAFGSRYDFGASLSAALSQAQATLGERSGIKTKTGQPVGMGPPASSLPRGGLGAPGTSGTESPRADALLANKHAVDSRAYQEFVSKFCFYGSVPAKPVSQLAKQSSPENGDGAQDDSPRAGYVGQGTSRGSLSPPKDEDNHGAAHFEHSPREGTPCGTRSPSPNHSGSASSMASPMVYGYPYQNAHQGFFGTEQHTATAIHG